MTNRPHVDWALLAVLRTASRGTLYRGKTPGTYFDRGRQVTDPGLLSAVVAAFDGGLLAHTERSYPTGVAVRADLTEAGYHRLVELRQRHAR